MEINRESVLEWLETHHRSRKWLQDQCEVTRQAVSNWLRENNPQPISANARETISKLMEEDSLSSQAKPLHHLVLEFSDAEYEVIEAAALRTPQTVRQWAHETLNNAALEDMVALAARIKSTTREKKPENSSFQEALSKIKGPDGDLEDENEEEESA